jgi:signal transduction histidine kinase
MQMSIAKKVTLIVSVMASILLAALYYVDSLVAEQELVDRIRTQAKLFAHIISLAAEPSLQNSGQLGVIEHTVSKELRIEVTFFDRDGRTVAPASTDEAPGINPRAWRVVERGEPEEELVAQAYAYRVPLRSKGKIAGSLELRLDLSTFAEPSRLRRSLAVSGGLLLLLALLVGLFSRTAIGKPIEHLMTGMDHVIRGDLTVALPLERTDEIGRIAYRFNEMTAQLRDAQEEIRRSAGARLALEQNLRQSEKLATIGQLSAEIAHEVGTPLNVIGGRARSLERKASQPAEVVKNAGIIADQADRITKIIQQVLDLSRARIPERTAVDLAKILGDALTLLEHPVARAKIQVVRQIPSGGQPRVVADADGLQQVFINLILNAVQAMPEGGQLTLALRAETRRKEGLDLAPPQPYVAVEVSDTGIGIADEDKLHIFEPFYSTKRRGEGTGLGLTVAHGIVKEHDGWIEVERATPRGTTFRVYLPAAVDEEDEDEAARATRAAESAKET